MCHGPEHDVCPLLVDDECEKLNAAHGIVFQLDLDRPKHRAILKRYQDVVAEDKPIVAVVRQGQKAKYRELLAGVQVWESEPTAAELDGLAATVEAADWSRE
jgi:hypothetical protein